MITRDDYLDALGPAWHMLTPRQTLATVIIIRPSRAQDAVQAVRWS